LAASEIAFPDSLYASNIYFGPVFNAAWTGAIFSAEPIPLYTLYPVADLDCWYDKEIHLKLPDADVSYIKAALLNWKQLLAEVKNITHTAVQHKGRTAYISKDDDQKTILTLEKLLYRK
jgi:hypothetical protein